ncbi:uncharacterized protein IAS62_002395 [Cryptococcus decagattii]|uniref:Uncharacterized protein n=1 Tax=Cryptococcus decagattii TaxID=1859122 RepID=A0ABZ2AV79_9TREE
MASSVPPEISGVAGYAASNLPPSISLVSARQVCTKCFNVLVFFEQSKVSKASERDDCCSLEKSIEWSLGRFHMDDCIVAIVRGGISQ